MSLHLFAGVDEVPDSVGLGPSLGVGPSVGLAHQLATMTRLVRDHFDRRLCEENATVPTWMILSSLMSRDQVSERELAMTCHMEAPTLTRHLDRLMANGIVRRQRDRRDRRIVRVALTREGRAHYLRIGRIAGDLEASLEALLSDSERTWLAGRLAAVIDELS